MEIETLADMKLLRRAINSGWNVSNEIKKNSMSQVAKLTHHPDPKIALLAVRILISADSADDKKAMAEQRRLEAEHARKLQLLELAIKHRLIANDGSATRGVDSEPSASK